MSWYKQSQEIEYAPIAIVSYIKDYGQLGISFNGGEKYTYEGVSPYIYRQIDTLLKFKSYSRVGQILRNLSANNKKQDDPQMKLF